MPEHGHPSLPVETIQREMLEAAIDVGRLEARLTRLQSWITLPENHDEILDATEPHTLETALYTCLGCVRHGLKVARTDLRQRAKVAREEAAELDRRRASSAIHFSRP